MVVSELVAPVPALFEELVPEDIEPEVEPAVEPLVEALSFVLVPAPVPTVAPAVPLAFVSVLVLWAAAIWLKETASKPENSTGKNLRIWFLQGWEVEIQKSWLQMPCQRLLRRFDRLTARQAGRIRRNVALMRPGVGVHRLALFLGNGCRAAGCAIDAPALEQFLLSLLVVLLLRLRFLRWRLGLSLCQRDDRKGKQCYQ